MFSFSTIAVFATLAFSAVTSAIPTTGTAGELAVREALPVASVDNLAIVGRADEAQDSLAKILTDAQTQLLPFTNQLSTFAVCCLY